MQIIAANCSLEQASTVVWDAIVIGAGLAGASCALELARTGHRILLVDKAEFPRDKVCGCCLNAAAIDALHAMHLSGLLSQHDAVPLHEFAIHANGRKALISADLGVALSRRALDATILGHAIASGVSFLDRVTAAVAPVNERHREIILRRQERSVTAKTRIIIVADGLAGRSLENQRTLTAHIDPRSHIGLAAILSPPHDGLPVGRVVMACGKQGYVGMVTLEDGRLNIASALAPAFIKSLGGAAPAVMRLLQDAGLTVPQGLESASWTGTPQLTRRRNAVASDRLFILGDAAGYVEPFTGEGMAWALRSAVALAPLASHAIRSWRPGLAADWIANHRRLIRRRQWSCRMLTTILRRPLLTRIMITLADAFPRSASRFINRLHAPHPAGAIAWT